MESGRGWRKNQEMGRKYSPGLNIWREIKSRRISYNATVTTTKREGKERKKTQKRLCGTTIVDSIFLGYRSIKSIIIPIKRLVFSTAVSYK